MNVIEEILVWSEERPDWQREALRILLENGKINDSDIARLVDICKSEHGLAKKTKLQPLSKNNVPSGTLDHEAISLDSIFHHKGVNALAQNQSLNFGKNLTVVYGDNGAGKTGYIRILKNSCRARGQEQILGNVISGTSPEVPLVSIKYFKGDGVEVHEFADNDAENPISRVSVFDTQSASVYLTEKTDVAFRPFGLDLFDKLVSCCREVKAVLEQERRDIEKSGIEDLKTAMPPNTEGAETLANISSLTKETDVERMTRFDAESQIRLETLEKQLNDLSANDPQKLIRQLEAFQNKITKLNLHLQNVLKNLSAERLCTALTQRIELEGKEQALKNLRESTFSSGVLPGTGSEDWKDLWTAAEKYSTSGAYEGKSFPNIEEGAQCVLCQQELDSDASKRLTAFQIFITSTVEGEYQTFRNKLRAEVKSIRETGVLSSQIQELIDELKIEHEKIATDLETVLRQFQVLQEKFIESLKQKAPEIGGIEVPDEVPQGLQEFIKQTAGRIASLRTGKRKEKTEAILAEIAKLKSEKLLTENKAKILEEIERLKRFAAYGLAINDTRSNTITQKSTAITKEAVTEKLKESFDDELKRLNFKHVEVELKEAGGSGGALYHKLILTRAPGVELPKVASEGEQRCLSIAAFFAELSTAKDPSGIVFDDPVSSLDYRWREGVAKRLVEEAAVRQVIVFTHDVVFLLLLKRFADEKSVDLIDQHVRNSSRGAGVCEQELPWVAMPVKKKIGYLKNEAQRVSKLERDGHQTVYEREAIYLYGLLREAWERALEEKLLGNIVERYRPSVQTMHVDVLTDIQAEDCTVLKAAMTKCSQWLPGHDQAAAARAAVPDSAELSEDINDLAQWVKEIDKRR